jgi:superfamily I DNA and/or RNA helicase
LAIDVDYSDLLILRNGETEHPDGTRFQLNSWLGETNDGIEVEGLQRKAGKSSSPHKYSNFQSMMELLDNSDIVCSTCAGAGSQRMSNAGEFDIIIIDEAGQATEPDALVPLSRFLTSTAVVLFICDTKFGPTILSHNIIVRDILLTSIMERLSACKYSNIAFVNQNMQYRMHSTIARFINKNFYNGGLLSERNHAGQSSMILKKRALSAVSVDTTAFCRGLARIRSGANLFLECGEGSGSCWNKGEAMLVGKVILRLRVDNPVTPAEIAVITPYAEQKGRLRKSA